MDIVCALAAFAVFGWLYLLIAFFVRIKLGTPVLFRQQRPGKYEKIFNLYKFRTMTNAKDKNGKLLPDGERLTKFGRFLRKTSLDELPEAFNILIGDMSVIGPRPLLVRYLPLYNEHQKHRHDVRPGLSGWAQVNGRNTVSWKDKFEYDVYYANHVTFGMDIKIVVKTVLSVLKREGIDSESSKNITLEEFNGNN